MHLSSTLILDTAALFLSQRSTSRRVSWRDTEASSIALEGTQPLLARKMFSSTEFGDGGFTLRRMAP